MQAVDINRLRAELARKGLTQRALAAEFGVAPTTFSGWLRRAHPGPNDLRERIERSLGLPEGALTSGGPT
jgi:transcriptional regulator with XRE-family HTH domain